MRKLLYITVAMFLLLLAAPALMAQEKARVRRHTFEVGYGFWPVLQVSSKLGGSGGWGSSWERESRKFLGAINLGYTLDVSKRMQLGVTCSYSNLKEEYGPVSPGSTYEYRLEKTKSWAVMPKMSYKWYDQEDGQVYSSLLMGVDVLEETTYENARLDLNEKKKMKELAWQVTLLGAKVGNRRGVFAEIGFGSSGFGIGGVFLKL